jgi:hypothetical protein
MGDGTSGWPSVGKTDENIEVHAHILKNEIKELQHYAAKDGKTWKKTPGNTLKSLLESVEAFVNNAVAAKRKEQRLEDALHQIKTKTKNTNMLVDSLYKHTHSHGSTSTGPTHIKTWAKVAATHPTPPVSIPASIVSRNSSAAARIDEPEHREITIHFENEDDASLPRSRGEEWVVKKLNECIDQSRTMVNNALTTASAARPRPIT